MSREMNVNGANVIKSAARFSLQDHSFSTLSDILGSTLLSKMPQDLIDVVAYLYTMVKNEGTWDHKPTIQTILSSGSKFNAFKTGVEKDESYWIKIPNADSEYVNYDIWSNIHYGYVGKRAGIPDEILNLQQSYGVDDIGDRISVGLGYQLYYIYRTGFSEEQFSDFLVENLDAYRGTDKLVHYED
ncbi:hypothetical protein FACS1894125_7110 [Actinomycetota bacterium]|nr:hypothetical protein FACS1894125_7110 [Actinomycetota bacterium]